MMSLLSRYLSVLLIKRFLGLTAIVLLLGALMDFLDDKDRILNDSGGNVFEILKYMVFSSPVIFTRLSAMIALVAAVMTMIGLVRYRELIAVSSAGVSQWRLIAALFPAALAIAGFQFAMDNGALSKSAHELRDLGIGAYSPGALGQSSEIWLQEGDDILAIKQLGRTGEDVGSVNIFRMDHRGLLIGHISGERVRLDGGRLVFGKAVETRLDDQEPFVESELMYDLTIDPEVLWSLFLDPREMSWFDLKRILDHPNTGNRPYFVYELWFNKKLSAPLATLAIIMLAIPLVQRVSRVSNYFSILFLGLVLGFVFVVLDAVVVSFGEVGLLSPLVAAWTMTIVLVLFVATAIFQQELIKKPDQTGASVGS